MSDTSLATPGSAEAIERTPTGEIVDQTSKRAEAESPEATSTKETTTEAPSVLNEGDKDADKGPPAKYEFKLPEGAQLDEKAVEEASAIFKDLGLNNKGAQRLVDFYTAKMAEIAEAPQKAWTDTQKEWQAQIKNDKELGGKLPEVRSTVARAIDSLGDPALAKEFRLAMDVTGAGNHPAFIKTFYKLAQTMTEGKHVSGTAPSKFGQAAPGSTERPSTARALYPNNP
jgi:hypothetical protein